MAEEKDDGNGEGDDGDTVVVTPSPPVGTTVTSFSNAKPLSEFEKGLSRTPYREDHFDQSYTPLSGKYIWNKNWIYANRSICDDNSKLSSTVRGFRTYSVSWIATERTTVV